MQKHKKQSLGLESTVLGGGCFWCLDEAFSHVKGVISTTAGYAGGEGVNPSYEAVSTSTTGYAEVVKIVFDPKIISFAEILEIYFSLHDPTTLNRQGNDLGPQYRSIILYDTPEKKVVAKKIIQKLTAEKIYSAPFVTELRPLTQFYPAEEYHQKYFQKNPDQAYCQIVIAPKLSKLRRKFSEYYRENNSQ